MFGILHNHNLWNILNKFFSQHHLLYMTFKKVNIFMCIPLQLSQTFSKSNASDIAFETSSHTNIQKLRLRAYFTNLTVAIQLCQFLFILNNKTAEGRNYHTSDTIFALFFWLGLAVSSSYAYLTVNNGPILKTYLSNLFLFQKKYGMEENFEAKYRHRPMELLNLLFIPMGLLTVALLPPV